MAIPERGRQSLRDSLSFNIRKIAVPRAGCNPWAELSRLDSKVFVLSIYYRSIVREISRTVGPKWALVVQLQGVLTCVLGKL